MRVPRYSNSEIIKNLVFEFMPLFIAFLKDIKRLCKSWGDGDKFNYTTANNLKVVFNE
jgi:hypothetical protein